jgi:hypothetical protein
MASESPSSDEETEKYRQRDARKEADEVETTPELFQCRVERGRQAHQVGFIFSPHTEHFFRAFDDLSTWPFLHRRV